MPADLGASVVLKHSMIQGVGLFAMQDISEGEFLQYTHIYNPKHKDWISLDPNYKYNHSASDENCEVVMDEKVLISYDGEDVRTFAFKLLALKNIPEGDELLVNYIKNESLEQPEKGWK